MSYLIISSIQFKKAIPEYTIKIAKIIDELPDFYALLVINPIRSCVAAVAILPIAIIIAANNPKHLACCDLGTAFVSYIVTSAAVVLKEPPRQNPTTTIIMK